MIVPVIHCVDSSCETIIDGHHVVDKPTTNKNARRNASTGDIVAVASANAESMPTAMKDDQRNYKQRGQWQW